MDSRKKNIIYSVVLLLFISGVWLYRKSDVQEPLRVAGETMGTTYHITYFDKRQRNFKFSVDSLLFVVNKSINNYDSTSEVSAFNKSQIGIQFKLPYLYPPLQVAEQVWQASGGAFDLTVMPLVNAWGFGPGRQLKPDKKIIDSMRSFIGFDKIRLSKSEVAKTHPYVQLDFGGIGQGYGADVITDFLKAKGIQHMLVELGGEGMAVGKNLKTGKPWEIGILDPNSTHQNQFFKVYVSLSDRSFTTSGNYFNYHEIDGVKYSHTIDPLTGYPAKRALLSASVFAKDCTTADAWGTAFMVMGHEKAIETLKAHHELDAFLIYTAGGKTETFTTPGLTSLIKLATTLQ